MFFVVNKYKHYITVHLHTGFWCQESWKLTYKPGGYTGHSSVKHRSAIHTLLSNKSKVFMLYTLLLHILVLFVCV